MSIDLTTRTIAEELRKKDFSYSEISEQLGVSISWCKQNLKNVKSDSDVAVVEICNKAKSPDGITRKEIADKLGLSSFDNESKEQIMKTVKKIRRISKENVVRYDWQIPGYGLHVTKNVIQTAKNIADRINEESCEIIFDLENSGANNVPNTRSLNYAVAFLVFKMCSNTPESAMMLSSMLESLMSNAATIDSRNDTKDIKQRPVIMKDESDDLEEFIF